MTSEEMFKSLVRNAIEFLDRSVSEFNAAPKHSLIDFYTAIELFLKARLMVEHWALIVTKPEEADYSRFIVGDFQSVSFEGLNKRLKNIAKTEIPLDAYECFNRVRQHRNKIVHFFHPDYVPSQVAVAITEIVTLQCRSWYYLNSLLTARWEREFLGFADEFKRLDLSMHRHKDFLKAKFDVLKPGIDDDITKNGATYSECVVCGFKAAHNEARYHELSLKTCRVCLFNHTSLKVVCSSCGLDTWISNPWSEECDHCHSKIKFEELIDIYPGHTDLSSRPDPSRTAYCEECHYTGLETVYPFYEKSLCLSCLSLYDPENLGQCGWCGEYVTGEVGDYYSPGCFMCAEAIRSELEDN